jgi:hypothetical protein
MALARDLRIGQRVAFVAKTKDEEPEYIRALNELCAAQPTPHVHVRTNKTSRCLPFTRPV